jgi:GNAT superfamily N-acetyltransferase
MNCEAGLYLNDEIVGMVEYVLYDGELTVSNIIVRPEYRRMGYASRLMKYIRMENPDYKYIPSLKTDLGAKFEHKDISIDESFKRNDDKLSSLGLGKIIMIEEWLNKYLDCEYKINPDLTIDVHGVIMMDNMNIGEFPEYIQFNKADDTFSLTNTKLHTLRGCPREVGSNFYCDVNNLTSLEFAPEKINGNLYMSRNNVPVDLLLRQLKDINLGGLCYSDLGVYDRNSHLMESFSRDNDNKLKNLGVGKINLIKDWLEKYNIKNYFIDDNDLTISVLGDVYLNYKNIDKFPDYIQFIEVAGYFACSANRLSSLRGCPKKVGESFYCAHNDLVTLNDGPDIIGGDFECSYNQLNSLEGCPRISGTLYCKNNKIHIDEIERIKVSNTVHRTIFESFTKGEDKLKNLNIGWRQSIESVLLNYNVKNVVYNENKIFFDCEIRNLGSSPVKIEFCLDKEILRSFYPSELKKYTFPTSIKTANDLIEALDNFDDDWIDRSYNEKFNWNW